MPLTLEESAQPYVEASIGGESFRFGKLTVRDRCRIMNELKRKRREQLTETMKASGVDAASVVGTLSDFDATEMTELDFIRHVNTLDGQLSILEIALRKHHADKVDDILDKITTPTVELVAALCGLTLNTPGDPDPNPQAAPSEGAAHQTPGSCYGS